VAGVAARRQQGHSQNRNHDSWRWGVGIPRPKNHSFVSLSQIGLPEVETKPKSQPEIVLLGEDSIRGLSGVLNAVTDKGDVEIEQARELSFPSTLQDVLQLLELLPPALSGPASCIL